MELYIAKVIGFYFIIVSIITMIRQKTIMPIMKDLVRNRSLVFVLGVFELVAGILLIMAYPVIAFNLEGFISFIGYILTIEGIFYLVAPKKYLKRCVASFNTRQWYLLGGAVGCVIGICLLAVGYGLF